MRMNVKNHLIEIPCSHKDSPSVAQALLHSILFFRTYGKFNYKYDENYSIGTLGFERVNCDKLDFSYIRASSPTLTNRVNSKIQEFIDKLTDNTQSGTITLEFYTRRPNRWPFNDSKIVWELWTIKMIMMAKEQCSQRHLEDLLGQKMLDIIKIVNNDKSTLPQMPTQPNLETVFDTSLYDLQPYLHNISYKISENMIGIQSPNIFTDSTTQSSLKRFLLGTLEL